MRGWMVCVLLAGGCPKDPPAASGDPGEAVTREVDRRSGKLTYCYEHYLSEDPELAGRVVLRWNVTAGKVSDAAVVENTTGNAAHVSSPGVNRRPERRGGCAGGRPGGPRFTKRSAAA